MTYDRRLALALVEQNIARGNYGIEAKTLRREIDEMEMYHERMSCPWKDCYKNCYGTYNGLMRPKFWSKADSFLRIKFGTEIFYQESENRLGTVKTLEKTIGRYSSPTIQSKLSRTDGSFTERIFLKDVDIIKTDCDLRGTTVTAIPKLKTIGGNLTIDSSSRLKSMPMLKQIGGKLTVIARNKDDMLKYLAKLGIDEENVSIGEGIHFVMKSFL